MQFGSLFKSFGFGYFCVILSAVLYALFAYDLVRTEHSYLLFLYFALFFLFYRIIKFEGFSFKLLIGFSILFRLIFLFAIPNLSQDFYRFIWDGRMILEGFNPYLYTPQSFIEGGIFPINQSIELYQGMGELNGSHFTNYPPVNQLCFIIAGLFAGKSILGSAILMRLIIILADIGIIYFGRKLLRSFNLSDKNIFWFILNPLIIIELTGNLHFEGVMIFFLMWSLYLLRSGRWKWAAVVFALSISTKLIPLMFLPLFFWWFLGSNLKLKDGRARREPLDYNFARATADKSATELIISTKPRGDIRTNNEIGNGVSQKIGVLRLIAFYSVVGFTTLALFLPFYSSEFINNYSQTVALWFQNFEFNASLYYVAREIGYLFRGYNEIAIIGKWTAIIVFVSIIAIAFFRKNNTTQKLIVAMLFAFSIYLFTTTTVHPWYLATLLVLSVFTPYRFPLVWSATVILSYLAYKSIGFQESAWVLGLEYIVVFGVLVWEILIQKPKPLLTSQTLPKDY